MELAEAIAALILKKLTPDQSLRRVLDIAKDLAIRGAIKKHGSNSSAAKALGIERTALVMHLYKDSRRMRRLAKEAA